MAEEIIFKPIGIIHAPYYKKEQTQIQGCFAPKSRGHIDVYPEYAEGIKDFDIKESVKDGWYRQASERSRYPVQE